MSYRVAVIGCGAMGGAHANLWAQRPDAAIAAVYDPDADRARAMADAHGAVACPSHREAIDTEGVNVVSVCTPVAFHPEVSIHALERGKHVLCEKPIALTLEDADRMIAAAKAGGAQLAVSYQYRGNGRFQAYRRWVREGRFGGPVFLRFVDIREVRPKLDMHRKSRNGGPLVDMAGHFFDLARYITGAEAEEVVAHGHVFGSGKERLAGIDDLAIDAAEVLVRFAGGHVCSVNVNWGMPEGFPGMTAERIVGPAMAATPEGNECVLSFGDHREVYPPSGNQSPAVRIEDLVQAIEGRGTLEVDGSEGRRALAICLGALESIATGHPVALA